MNSNSSAVIIPPPNAPAAVATNELRGARPPVEIPNDWAWVGWTLLALALVAAAVWAWRYWQRRRVRLAPALVIPPHVRARQKLQAALAFISDPRVFCIQVSDALRVYLEERFAFRAPERTTEEFLVELQGSSRLTAGQKESLSAFLQSCDLVKFARFEPTEAALRELHDAALRLVEETQFDRVQTPGNPQPPPLPVHAGAGAAGSTSAP